MSFLEHLVKLIREDNPRLPDESIDTWLARTWKIILDSYESEKPTLPLVQERQERSQGILMSLKKEG